LIGKKYVASQRLAPTWGILADMEKFMSMAQVKDLSQLGVR